MSRVFHFAKFLCQLCAWCAFCPVSAENPDNAAREWMDVDGRVIHAVLRGVKDDRVILLKEGKEYVFPLSRLSARDREYVIKLRREKQAGAVLTKGPQNFPYLTDKELAIAPKISVELLEKTVLSLTNELRKALKQLRTYLKVLLVDQMICIKIELVKFPQ